MNRKHYFLAAALLYFSACSAPAPVRGYGGPEKAESQVALLKASWRIWTDSTKSWFENSEETDARAEVDGVMFREPGITLLPGAHRYALRFYNFIWDQCSHAPSFAGKVVFDILTHDDVAAYETNRYCVGHVRLVECAGTFETRPGIKYELLYDDYGKLSLVAEAQALPLPSCALGEEKVMKGSDIIHKRQSDGRITAF